MSENFVIFRAEVLFPVLQINILKTHMLVHSNRREYVCEVEGCTYAFKTKGSLRRHMRRHTGTLNRGSDTSGHFI